MSGARILVTGCTGYVGARLVPLLLARGFGLRCLVRDAARVRGRSWADEVEIVEGDVLDADALRRALAGISVAYYLIHSMRGGAGFHRRDIEAARGFGRMAAEAGVERIVYLGGLGDPTADLSEHLASRQQTGRALAEGGVPVTELRAAVVVGAGSVSFEMIRYLTERLPVMICPRWVYTRVQPIAVRDVLDYLLAVLDEPRSAGRIIEIGGADVLTYGGMMLGYASVRGLRRRLQPVPVLTPRLSSYWVHLVTPIPDSMARPLIEGLRSEVVVRDDLARRLFLDLHPLDYRSAVREALANLDVGKLESAWSDAAGCGAELRLATEAGFVLERRERVVEAPADAVFRVVCGLGGRRGYYYWDWAWRVRGALDRLIGGVGLRRGRRDADELRVGDALDFWRVEEVEPNRLLRLRAEMKVPGAAWLQFEIRPAGESASRLVQTAFFAPRGLAGHLYWYGLYPLHRPIFSGMIQGLAAAAESSGGRSV